MITTPEIICDFLSFLDKDQIERIQLVNQFCNNVIIRHKNILPLRQFTYLTFIDNIINLYERPKGDFPGMFVIYSIKFEWKNLRKVNVSSQYSHLSVDEVLANLKDVVFTSISVADCDSEYTWNDFLTMMKLVRTKTEDRFRGRFGYWEDGRFGSKLVEIFDNYIIVDDLALTNWKNDSYIREVCANPDIVQLPSTPKEIRLIRLEFKENEEVLHFTCNGKLNGANRVTIEFGISPTNYGNFIRQWFELYCTHQNPISLVGRFELTTYELRYFLHVDIDRLLDAVKTFLNNTQLRVKYSLEHSSFYSFINQYVKRSCVLHETDSYVLVIEMEYGNVTDMSSINASDLDQPPCNKMKTISFCVKSL